MSTPKQRHRAFVAQIPSRYHRPRPRRERALSTLVVGDSLLRSESPQGEDWEYACDGCGYLVCSCAPEAEAAPRIGPEVRYMFCSTMEEAARITLNPPKDELYDEELALYGPRAEPQTLIADARMQPGWTLRLERAHGRTQAMSEPTPAPDAWSPESCGWTRKGSFLDYSQPGLLAWARAAAQDGAFAWWSKASGAAARAGCAPTLAQACCLALGIELDEAPADCGELSGTWMAFHDGNALTGPHDCETAARRALAEYHRRAQDAADPVAECERLGIEVHESVAFPGRYFARKPGEPAFVWSTERITDRDACARLALERFRARGGA